MATYIGFLRAINLGSTRKFPKAAIIAATEAAGFTDVLTYINTGNVRFSTTHSTNLRSRSKIEQRLEMAYEAAQGFAVPTIVFTQTELREVAADAQRLAEVHTGKYYVSLLKDLPSAEQARVMEERSTQRERVHVSGRAVHLLLEENYREARLTNAAVEKALGVATNRNLTVISALAQKWC